MLMVREGEGSVVLILNRVERDSMRGADHLFGMLTSVSAFDAGGGSGRYLGGDSRVLAN